MRECGNFSLRVTIATVEITLHAIITLLPNNTQLVKVSPELRQLLLIKICQSDNQQSTYLPIVNVYYYIAQYRYLPTAYPT